MIIDCHGHYTTAPAALQKFRDEQIAGLKTGIDVPSSAQTQISDDEIRNSLENAQLKLQRARGTDWTIFSPRESAMAHHVGNETTSRRWTQACNDLIHRVVSLYPDNFVGVCQLPQSPGVAPVNSAAELERCVKDLGFIGCNLNPDPSGGHWTSPPLTDRHWYPLYEKMVELDVPAMVHVSSSCNPNFHATGAHYINADTTAFMQFIQGDLFADFPDLRLVIPHGGGAVPYHWGRYRGLADMLKKPPLREHVMNNVFFDTCVYHQPGIDLLLQVIDIGNVLFGSEIDGAVRDIGTLVLASEMVGTVCDMDPETGRYFDDTKRYIDAAELTEAQSAQVFSGNARRVYPRLDKALRERGLYLTSHPPAAPPSPALPPLPD